jgi:glycosyltransferase involved in cell wall biosynthesis
MISVIIPAYNEERVIVRCLAALTAGAEPGELEVVVVCNGCKDRTADVAREFGGPVRVIETPTGSKVHALNLGDAATPHFPRFYVDADVVVPLESIRRMARRLESGDVLAVGARPRFDLSQSSWPVRAYYQIHDRLPASREGVGGSGVYGLSREGRARFGPFPPLTADDAFVRIQFRPGERETAEENVSVVYAPATLRDLISIKTRSHLGASELKRKYSDLRANMGPGNSAALRRLALRPRLWPKLAAYGLVKVATRVRSYRQTRGDRSPAWERDETSRATVVTSTH